MAGSTHLIGRIGALSTLAAAACGLALTPEASAVPVLQLYIEGATYIGDEGGDDAQDTDTWVYSPPGSSDGEPFRLWTIGMVKDGDVKNAVKDVRLSVTYDGTEYDDLVINLTSTQIDSSDERFTDWIDTTTAMDPVWLREHTIDSRSKSELPRLGYSRKDGLDDTLVDEWEDLVEPDYKQYLSSHSELTPGTTYQEFYLGDFDETSSNIGDVTKGVVEPQDGFWGQINVYEVTVTRSGGGSAHGARLHFDLYDHIEGDNRAKFAPYSHDAGGAADGTTEVIPTPTAAGAGLVGFFLLTSNLLRRRRAA